MPDGVRSEYPIEVAWEGKQRFRGGKAGVPQMVLDGERLAGPGPVDALIVAIASCSGIDVLEILEKRRTPATALVVTVEFSRAATPPRRLTDITLHFEVAVDSDASHVERAIELSIQKYCSVSATFAPDTRISWTVRLRPAAEAQPPS